MKMGMFNLSLFSGSGEQLAKVWLRYGTQNVLLMYAMQMCNKIEIE